MRSFEEFTQAAKGHTPYAYQKALAEKPLPQLLRAPTGSGKTAAAVLPWMWRLTEHPDEAVRRATPRWLVYVLPLRSLVEQTASEVQGWIGALNRPRKSADDAKDEQGRPQAPHVDVRVHVLLGGVQLADDDWQLEPNRPAVFVGTQDMVLSRLLMRGYAESRASWPLSFGLLHAGVQFVCDETQLMGPALETTAQLQGLRNVLGSVSGSATMWMSATLDDTRLRTPDHHAPTHTFDALDYPDDALRHRLDAVRAVEHLETPGDAKAYPVAIAEESLRRHRPGTRTIVIVNQVRRAQEIHAALAKALTKTAGAPQVMLLHSRFRPNERAALTEKLKKTLGDVGQIVVATQVLEAGVDVTSSVLVTEAAPWSSIVQRAGRCNRDGNATDARLLWTRPPGSGFAPYDDVDVERAMEALTALEGHAMTSTALGEVPVVSDPPVYPVLRRRDLLQLFDTMPDLEGSDIDVSRWIRDGDDTTVSVAWREWPDQRPGEHERFPSRDELCPAPVAEVRKALARDPGGWWTFDQIGGGCRRLTAADVRPGTVVLADTRAGCYDPATGWDPRHRAPVPAVSVPEDRNPSDSTGADHRSCADRWVDLPTHLDDVDRDVRTYAERLASAGVDVPQALVHAAAVAGRYHDLGKAHDVFQTTLLENRPDGEPPDVPGPWAKSKRGLGRHSRRFFRHELVTALALAHPDVDLLDQTPDPDLVTYLAAAHHGKVRVSVRSMPGETERAAPRVLGVEAGDPFGPVDVPDGPLDPDDGTRPGRRTVPAITLDPSMLFLGDRADGAPSWTERVLRLRDDPELGPFRLGFLEALVRIADRNASRSYRNPETTKPATSTSAPGSASSSASDDRTVPTPRRTPETTPTATPGPSTSGPAEPASSQEALW
ncbi:DEAD/DEAH box helicase [Embleya sp. NPDC050493]|uniref:type I-G CRISPR-associated helicase/endonuclease Cas3g n=1 Tax=Embleya sp. NPDC050493 TaxID=3363989 RepID=UPI0037A4C8F7